MLAKPASQKYLLIFKVIVVASLIRSKKLKTSGCAKYSHLSSAFDLPQNQKRRVGASRHPSSSGVLIFLIWGTTAINKFESLLSEP